MNLADFRVLPVGAERLASPIHLKRPMPKAPILSGQVAETLFSGNILRYVSVRASWVVKFSSRR
jgi:hypothetical protein